jgi:hypothetical protein
LNSIASRHSPYLPALQTKKKLKKKTIRIREEYGSRLSQLYQLPASRSSHEWSIAEALFTCIVKKIPYKDVRFGLPNFGDRPNFGEHAFIANIHHIWRVEMPLMTFGSIVEKIGK